MTEKQETEVLKEIENADIDIHLTCKQIDKFVDDLKVIEYNHSYIGQVEQFHKFFNQVINNKPTQIDTKTIELRLALILEELSEIAEGCGDEEFDRFATVLVTKSLAIMKKIRDRKDTPKEYNIEEIFDALLDTQYVLSGSVLAFGLQHIFNEGFEQVQESNMSKACYSFEDAEETKTTYQTKGVECHIDFSKQDEGIWLVMRNSDKKVLKSNKYKPFDSNNLLNEII